MRLHTYALAAALLVSSIAACDDATPTAEEPLGTVVEAGKADDFYARTAQEYYVEGTATIVLDSSWRGRDEADRLAEVRRLIPFKQVVIGWFLNSYIVEKEHSEKDAYGGFKALTKNGAYEDLDITAVDELTWTFDFRQEIGGQLDLIRALPDAKGNADGSWTFPLVIGKISNADMQKLDTDREWYRSSPWGSFNPANVSADRLETLPLTIRPEPASEDAWMDTERLFADGLVTVGVHFGWDYHSAYHEKHSRSLYDWLVAKGFESPVASYDELRHDSGPLTREVTYHGREVVVEISLFWGQKGLDTDPDTAAGGRQLEADMLDSLANREVVMFSGHSGPFYGFALANWRTTSEGDLDDSELAEVPLMTGQYQLIIAEGCDTYALGQAFYDNPYKDGLEDLDVITTTSFSNASTVASAQDVLGRLFGAYSRNVVEPALFSGLISDLDSNSYWFTTMYGVHGIDDNPKVHPWADLARSCAACDRNADCGDGMRCVTMKDGARGCAAECTATTGCLPGYSCRAVQTDGWLSQTVCAPETLSCAAPVEERQIVLINEVMPTPAADYNGDGKVATSDEYVEVGNASAFEVDLSGWSLSDGVGVRHVFPTGTVLPPGGVVLVFAGGEPTIVPGTTVVQTASTGRLGLNDSGDMVRLADVDGESVGAVRYPGDIGKGKAMNRATDLDEADTWTVTDPTPGTRQDGARF
ncbi:MAG: hypothetical protein CVU56_21185 [Deltaproteobacteria bacterium HGW-Deltaproteobacteria-14]|jgi:hypothetical protein|nr:MAG: hypothetical protein CVU56_21185 [Deltaproteobacteria bacterium HGW-Deltaproteobacteria-14]